MVEGLTSSATDQGSVAGRSWIDPRLDIDSKIEDLNPAPARSSRSGASAAAEHHPDATNPGDSSGEATPVPIPNTEVKLSSAEDTERAAFRENRSSPGFLRFRGVRCAGLAIEARPTVRSSRRSTGPVTASADAHDARIRARLRPDAPPRSASPVRRPDREPPATRSVPDLPVPDRVRRRHGGWPARRATTAAARSTRRLRSRPRSSAATACPTDHVECAMFRAARAARAATLAGSADPALVAAADLRRRPIARTAPDAPRAAAARRPGGPASGSIGHPARSP